tara:strand:- start:28 stop:618 length:591 start_codon:yes stop_codon:yes gene_type:complete
MREASLETAVKGTRIPGLDIIPSSMALSGIEIELSDTEDRQSRFRNILANHTANYDYVIIDCPPALGLLTVNALVASHSVLVPLQCEFFALEGMSHLMQTIKRIQEKHNPSLSLQGIVLTMYDTRNNLSNAVADDVRAYFGEKVYKTVIPRNVRVSEAPSHGHPVLIYDINCAGSQAYLKLASELINREQKRQRNE